MPITITDTDGGIGCILTSQGVVTDLDLNEDLIPFFTNGQSNFKNYKYILIDHTQLTKMDVRDETIELVAESMAKISNAYPEPIVALVASVSIGANLDLISRVSRMLDLFIHGSKWESMIFRTRSEAIRWLRGKVSSKFGLDELVFD